MDDETKIESHVNSVLMNPMIPNKLFIIPNQWHVCYMVVWNA